MTLRRVMIAIAWILAFVLVILAAYTSYVFVSFMRIEDNQPLPVTGNQQALMPTGKQLTVLTANVGYGAFDPQFSFFMEGGSWSRAASSQAVGVNTQGIVDVIKDIQPALVLLQEVDVEAHRSHFVDQSQIFRTSLRDWGSIFAINYNSGFLAYPLHQPIGKTLSGIMALSRYNTEDGLRVSLPIEGGFEKLFDLDRCLSQQRIKVDNGRYLTLINVHFSAYTKDEKIKEAQLKRLIQALEEARDRGDYVICGGDFNRDMMGGTSSRLFGFESRGESWETPLDFGLLPQGFTVASPTNAPTARAAGVPYVAGETYVAVIDGFILSDDVQLLSVETVDTQFAYSDHNPVRLDFMLG